MANNPYVNKVVSNSQTLIDLTSDTVAPASVLAGVTFHDMSGASCVGTASMGKVIASIAPASVPVAWSNVVATYELVCRDFDTQDTTRIRTYDIAFANNQTSISHDDYGFTMANGDRLSVAMDSADPWVSVVAPDGSTNSISGVTPTTTTRTATSKDDKAWLAGILKNRTAASAYLYFPDNSLQYPNWYEAVASPTVALRSIQVNDDSTYTLTFVDGTTATAPAYSGSIVTTNSGNEVVVGCECVNVTGTPVYGAGYLVTYTDSSTETFVAASGDIADGSY